MYWYLRLNGFFPLPNFVLHRNVENGAADADMLAIRLPGTYEEVGGLHEDWDHERFGGWGVDISKQVALIVEVKTSPDIYKNQDGATRAFSVDRLVYAAQRLGFTSRDEARTIGNELSGVAKLRHAGSDTIVAKLLVTATPLPHREDRPYLTLTLAQAADFIRARMQKYKRIKVADRMFFPSDLLQYLIWNSKDG